MTETDNQDTRVTRIAPYYRSLRLETIKLALAVGMWAMVMLAHREQPTPVTDLLATLASWAVVLYIAIEAVTILMVIARNAAIQQELTARRPTFAERMARAKREAERRDPS